MDEHQTVDSAGISIVGATGTASFDEPNEPQLQLTRVTAFEMSGAAVRWTWAASGFSVSDVVAGPAGEVAIVTHSLSGYESQVTVLDASGHQRWNRSFENRGGVTGSLSFNAGIFTPAGDLIVAGSSYGPFSIDGIESQGTASGPILIKLAGANGSAVWARGLYPGSGFFLTLARLSDGNYAAGGLFTYGAAVTNWAQDDLTHSGEASFLVTFTGDNEPQWGMLLDGPPGAPLLAVDGAEILVGLVRETDCTRPRMYRITNSGEQVWTRPLLSTPCDPGAPNLVLRGLTVLNGDAVAVGTFTGRLQAHGAAYSATERDGFIAMFPSR